MAPVKVPPGAAKSAAGLLAAITLASPVVMKWEGKRNDPYLDVAHVKTVCWGETLNVQERIYTDAECAALLDVSLQKHGGALQRCIPDWTPPPTHAAFISFAYNVGSQSACSSTAMKRLQAGNIVGACDAMMWWNKARNPLTGKLEVSKGITNRRTDERTLCLQGALR